jgi:death-on-curing protein
VTGENIRFLTLDEVKRLHEDGIRRLSPTESLDVLSEALLESAVMAPQQTMFGQYLNQDVAEMAAAYLVGLTCNHAFVNGNKRAGFAACFAFLHMNGYQLTLTEREAIALCLGVVEHRLDKEGAAKTIRTHVRPLP